MLSTSIMEVDRHNHLNAAKDETMKTESTRRFITATEAAGRIALECGILVKISDRDEVGFQYLVTADDKQVATAFRDGSGYKVKSEQVQDFIDDCQLANV